MALIGFPFANRFPAMLPPALGAPLKVMPGALQCRLGEMLLQRILRQPLDDGELDFLEGRHAAFEITDCGLSWTCTLRGGRLRLVERVAPEARIRCRLADVIRLARRREDPDTLFFQRRLSIQGDTELGLALKNLMDGMDPADLPRMIRELLAVLDSLLSQDQRVTAGGRETAGTL